MPRNTAASTGARLCQSWCTMATQHRGPRERSPEAQEATRHPVGHPSTAAHSKETPRNFLVTTARRPLLWLRSPAWKERHLFA